MEDPSWIIGSKIQKYPISQKLSLCSTSKIYTQTWKQQFFLPLNSNLIPANKLRKLQKKYNAYYSAE